YSAQPSAGAPFQIYLYDFQTLTPLLISQSFSSIAGGNGSSDSPVITGDGRFIAFSSVASDLVPGDTNAWPDILLYDRTTSTTTLLSANFQGTLSGNALSLLPVFSGDGQSLVFESWASDLVVGDPNASSDLFEYTLKDASSLPAFSATIGVDL